MRTDQASRKDHPGSAQARAKDIYPEKTAAFVSAADEHSSEKAVLRDRAETLPRTAHFCRDDGGRAQRPTCAEPDIRRERTLCNSPLPGQRK